MTVTSGFFNSVNHDRKYNAEEISSIFDGIILDGVYQGFGEALKVSGTSVANQVKIGSGRAWFNHTWTLNDEALYLTLPAANSTYPRIDAIILEVNNSSSVRANTIKYISGAAASSPTKPTLTNTTEVHQYPLAYITRPKASTTISAGNIENAIGTSACPIVTGVLEVLDDDRFIAQTIANLTTDFNTWFDGVKDVLDENAAVKLLSKINENTEKININTVKINNLYRNINAIPYGKYLGDHVSQEDYVKIKNGTYDAFLGDYWVINDHKYIIVGVDDYLGYDVGVYTDKNHHYIIFPIIDQNDNDYKNIIAYNSKVSTNDEICYFLYAQKHSIRLMSVYPFHEINFIKDEVKNIIYNDFGGQANIKQFPIVTNDGFTSYKYKKGYFEFIIPGLYDENSRIVNNGGFSVYVLSVGNSKLPLEESFTTENDLASINGIPTYTSAIGHNDPLYKRFLSEKIMSENSNHSYSYSLGTEKIEISRCFEYMRFSKSLDIISHSANISSGFNSIYLFNEDLQKACDDYINIKYSGNIPNLFKKGNILYNYSGNTSKSVYTFVPYFNPTIPESCSSDDKTLDYINDSTYNNYSTLAPYNSAYNKLLYGRYTDTGHYPLVFVI